MNGSQFRTINETARMLGVSRQTATKLMDAGELGDIETIGCVRYAHVDGINTYLSRAQDGERDYLVTADVMAMFGVPYPSALRLMRDKGAQLVGREYRLPKSALLPDAAVTS